MLNKITGLFLYLLPFLYSYSLYVIIVCTIAFISSIEEGYLIYRETKAAINTLIQNSFAFKKEKGNSLLTQCKPKMVDKYRVVL